MPKRRILDERTGEPCDYKALAEKCRALVKNEGLAWRQAAERVAKAANSVEYDSIVRNLNRYRRDHVRSGEAHALVPGEAVLYEAVEEWLDRLETRASALVDGDYPPPEDQPYAEVAAEAAQLRNLLEGRLDALNATPKGGVTTGALAMLGGRDLGPLTPAKLIRREHSRLSSLFGRIRHLQSRIAGARPGPYVIQDY